MKNLVFASALILAFITVSAQNKAIHIKRSGIGKPVIFLPGFTSPGEEVWAETAAALKGENESIFVSYAGFNGLPAIEMPWYQTIKKELITFIRDENLDNVVIIGHSMGGTLALDVAAELQDTVDELVLVDALPCMLEIMMPGVSADQLKYESPYNQQMLSMSDESFRQFAAMMSQNMTNRKEKIPTLKDWSVAADRKTFVYGYTDLLKLDLRKSLAQITSRTLILAAPVPNEDAVLATLESQFNSLSRKTIVIVPDSRHFIMFDQPELLTEKVNTFLSENE